MVSVLESGQDGNRETSGEVLGGMKGSAQDVVDVATEWPLFDVGTRKSCPSWQGSYAP